MNNDLISRKAAIDAIWDGVNMDIYTREVKEILEELPSIAHIEKVGHWKRVTDRTGHLVWKCDKCGFAQRFNTNYCPDCGAKM